VIAFDSLPSKKNVQTAASTHGVNSPCHGQLLGLRTSRQWSSQLARLLQRSSIA